MGRTRPLLRGLRHSHFLERIKKLDRQLKLLLKELPHVGHACASATKTDARRAISLLLRAVMSNGTHQFRVPPGHAAARDLRETTNVGVCRLGRSDSQRKYAVPCTGGIRH